MDDEKRNHPSYGLVSFSRVSIGGKCKLFGSNIETHHSAVQLEVHEAEGYTKFGKNHVMSKGLILRAMLSADQFSTLLTTMNMGPGTPCTMEWIKGEGRIDQVPTEKKEVDRTRDYFRSRIQETMQVFEDGVAEIEEILNSKKTIGKGDREDIRKLLTRVKSEYKSNMPFALEQFNEATDKLTQAAKAEVDAFVTHAAVMTGLEQLRKIGNGEVAPDLKQLGSADGEED